VSTKGLSQPDQAVWASVQALLFDFDGVFTDNAVYTLHDGTESVRCWRSDGIGLSRVKALDVKLAVISTEENPIVAVRTKKLGIVCRQGVKDKAEAVIRICGEFAVSPEYTLFVGNDINDIPAFRAVGLPVAVRDAYPEILPHVRYRTLKRGGYGAVRELCDLVFHAKRNAAGAM